MKHSVKRQEGLKMLIERGDIIWIEDDPFSKGHEQKGKRPALVISSGKFNKVTKMAIVCPITSKVKGFPFEVPVNNKTISGVVLSHHVKTIDLEARKASKACNAPKNCLDETIKNVKAILEIDL